jgi:hypothetical protein
VYTRACVAELNAKKACPSARKMPGADAKTSGMEMVRSEYM